MAVTKIDYYRQTVTVRTDADKPRTQQNIYQNIWIGLLNINGASVQKSDTNKSAAGR